LLATAHEQHNAFDSKGHVDQLTKPQAHEQLRSLVKVINGQANRRAPKQ